jgi:pilus assembly protein CpaB
MRRGGRILILFGLILAVITSGVTLFILRSRPQEIAAPPAEMTSVVVAFQNIDAYVPVPADAIGIKQWPKSEVPPDAILDPADAVGKLTRSPIFPGQILLSAMLVDKKTEEKRLGLGSDASFIIPAGKVAVAMAVDDISGIAGAIRAGDRVDILVSMRLREDTPRGTIERSATQLALQDVEVLRIGPWGAPAQQQNQRQRTITFLVDRQQALILKYLRENTLVDLALRAAGDHEKVKTETVGEDYIIREFDVRPR